MGNQLPQKYWKFIIGFLGIIAIVSGSFFVQEEYFSQEHKEKSFIARAIETAKNFANQAADLSGFFGRDDDSQSGGGIVVSDQSSLSQQAQLLPIKQCSFAVSQSPSRSRIIINEVAWMGGANGADDEWIELKNISSSEINLNGYQLIDRAEQIKIVFNGNNKISANGFYLLERTDDDSAPDAKADKIYSGALANTNEGLRLFNPDCELIDEVLANSNWPAGSNENKKTMERGDNFNWHASSLAGGTPKKENSRLIVQETKQQIQIMEEADNEVAPQISFGTSAIQQAANSPQQTQQAQQTASFKQCAFQTSQFPSRQKIIINEVAWMGGSSDFSLAAVDEWLELKNISDDEINLSGWQILDKSENIKIVFDGSAKILPQSFYLLERTDDNSVPGVSANLIYSGTLNNGDEGLRLFSSQCDLIDEVLASPDWPAGDNVQKRTMERSPDLSWHTYNGIAQNNIFGTPRKENSQPMSAQEQIIAPAASAPDTQSSSANHVLVSEIMVGVDGNADYEFIEIFNSAPNPIDLTGWSIKKRSSSGGESTLVSPKYFKDKIIPANKYLLLVNEGGYGSAGSPQADVSWPKSYTLAYSNNAIVVYNANSELVEDVGWAEIPKGQSFERESFSGKQFKIQPNPNPQNSQ
ncbi:MAG: lamin tail domain-containing protein [Patescibacteria group bacterium]